MKYAILIPLFIFGFSVTRAAEKAPTQFSTRTEAAVALWNKASPIPASNEFRVAMQRFENAATAFQEASFAIAPDAVFQTAVADANLSATLNAYKQAALEMLAALHAYQQQEREELRRTRQPTEQQNQILQKQTDSFRMFDE